MLPGGVGQTSRKKVELTSDKRFVTHKPVKALNGSGRSAIVSLGRLASVSEPGATRRLTAAGRTLTYHRKHRSACTVKNGFYEINVNPNETSTITLLYRDEERTFVGLRQELRYFSLACYLASTDVGLKSVFDSRFSRSYYDY